METTDYSIPLRRLPNGNHTFSFDCNDDLFTRVENALADGGNLHVDLSVHKNDHMMTLDFDVTGTVKVQCSVCLGMFDYPIEDCTGRITVELGDHFQEVNDELYIVDSAKDDLDVAQWIYELAVVCLPISPEHPLDDEGNSTCDPSMLDELDKYLVESEEEIQDKIKEANKGEIDPRWAALKGLLDQDKGN